MEEHVGLGVPHRFVEAQAAPVGVDAPALTDRVGGPREDNVGGVRGRRAEAAGGGPAPGLQVREVLEEDAIRDALARGQVGQLDAGREARLFDGGRSGHAPRVGERIGGRILHDHARRPVGSAPDGRAAGGHVAGRGAAGDRRASAVGGDDAGSSAGPRSRATEPDEAANSLP